MTILLDTNILIDVLNDRRGRRGALEVLLSSGHRLASCDVTVAEIYAGMRPTEARETDGLLSTLDYFATSRDAARRAGILIAEWARKGQTLALADTLIAAVAIENGLSLATDNRKHFPMTGIRFVALPQAQ
jgi:predicted nucleic acid-binding protein